MRWRANRLYRSAVAALLVVTLTTVALAASSCGQPSFSADTVSKIDAAIRDTMKTYSVPGAIVGVSEEGKGQYVKAYGQADTKTGRDMTVGDLFKAASVTKTITGTLVLELIDQGKLSLDDTLSKFDFAKGVTNADKITLRMLLNQTSGLPDPSNEDPRMGELVESEPRHDFTQKEVMDYGIAMPVLSEPGTQWHYSNWNYYILGMIVEKVTGKSLAEEMQAMFFDKLGMPNTRLDPSASFLQEHPHSNGYTWDEKSKKYIDVTGWSTSWTWAAGSAVTDIQDLMTWMKGVADGTLITPQMRKTRLADGASAGSAQEYLLGVMKVGNVYWHDGLVPGYNSFAGSDPDKKLTVCVFMNAMPGQEAAGQKPMANYPLATNTGIQIFKALGETFPSSSQ